MMTAPDVLKIKQISLPICYVAGLFATVSWLTTTYNQVEANRIEIIKIEKENQHLKEELKSLHKIVIKIDGKIDTALKILEVHGHHKWK